MALPGIIAGVATGIGALGSLFGSGSKTEIPPELRKIYKMLLERSQQGLSDQAVSQMLQRAKIGLGNEAGALSSLTQSRLTRAGAGTGVQQTALNRINAERLKGIGSATIDVGLADEQAKQQAMMALAQIAPMFGSEEFKSFYGSGFADLFGAGLNYFLNRPEKKKQAQQGTGIYDTPYGEPGERWG